MGIAQSFGDCLGGLLSVAAQNITIKINSKLDGYAVSSVCSHLASNITRGGMECTVNFGDVQAGETRELLFKVSLPTTVQAFEDVRNCLKVTVDFVNVQSSKFDSQTKAFGISRPPAVSTGAAPNDAVRDAAVRYEATQALRAARGQASRGDLADARVRLGAFKSRVEDSDVYQELQDDLLHDLSECLDGLADERAFAAGGAHAMACYEQSHAMQRRNRVSSKEETRQTSYSSPMRMLFRGKAKSST